MEEKSDYWDIAARKLRHVLSWEAEWADKERSRNEANLRPMEETTIES